MWAEWLRFTVPEFGDRVVEACRLILLADLPSYPAAARAHPRDSHTWIAPSLDLAVQFHRLEALGEWLLVRGTAPIAERGLIGFRSEVWDATGRLAASGSGQCLCRPLRAGALTPRRTALPTRPSPREEEGPHRGGDPLSPDLHVLHVAPRPCRALPAWLAAGLGASVGATDRWRALEGRDAPALVARLDDQRAPQRGGRTVAQVVQSGPVPTYEYRCRTCGEVFEERRAMSDSSAPATCPGRAPGHHTRPVGLRDGERR
ncbi:MAG: hypothetical protein KatS3mg010_0439 [Acidimicrobiia bacterium]|nr:MAG: hypothetical protein KatS3mg010_0439 [Acidimicrobiia bacterium]